MKLQASDQLITDDAKTELVKESQVHLLDLNPMETAAQIMVMRKIMQLFLINIHIYFFRQITIQVEDFTIFRQIEMTEYIDHLFVVCKGCDENSNIHDGRFKCTICPAYELCASCQKKGCPYNHKMIKDSSWYGCPNLKKFGALCDEEMKWVSLFSFG